MLAEVEMVEGMGKEVMVVEVGMVGEKTGVEGKGREEELGGLVEEAWQGKLERLLHHSW
jgi:hypothetical protein